MYVTQVAERYHDALSSAVHRRSQYIPLLAIGFLLFFDSKLTQFSSVKSSLKQHQNVPFWGQIIKKTLGGVARPVLRRGGGRAIPPLHAIFARLSLTHWLSRRAFSLAGVCGCVGHNCNVLVHISAAAEDRPVSPLFCQGCCPWPWTKPESLVLALALRLESLLISLQFSEKNLRIYTNNLYCQKIESLTYIFVADNMGLCSLLFTQFSLKVKSSRTLWV